MKRALWETSPPDWGFESHVTYSNPASIKLQISFSVLASARRRLLGKVLFVVPLIKSVIAFMEANLWQNVPNVEKK
jgi:hypothetical protein